MGFCSGFLDDSVLHLEVPKIITMTVTIRLSMPFRNSAWVNTNSKKAIIIHFLMTEKWMALPVLHKQTQKALNTFFSLSEKRIR